jgi:ubiquinone/menaquinone biosynthesis C-methylase UbiE
MYHPKGPTLWELARQALSSTDRGYDLIAPKFDYTPFRTPDAVLERVAEHTARDGKAARGLDICCGTGAGLRKLRPVCTEAIVGLDRSPGMLAEAERRLADAPGDAPIELVRGDALSMPFADEEFDLAFSFGAFGHILEEDEPAFVDEIRRVLKPGGRFVFVTAEMPRITSPELWMARGFNAVMRVRNAVIKPEFIMYYLTFLWPGVKWLLESKGFDVRVERDVFEKPFGRALLVTATKRPTG